jgi:hypothetical protein
LDAVASGDGGVGEQVGAGRARPPAAAAAWDGPRRRRYPASGAEAGHGSLASKTRTGLPVTCTLPAGDLRRMGVGVDGPPRRSRAAGA